MSLINIKNKLIHLEKLKISFESIKIMNEYQYQVNKKKIKNFNIYFNNLNNINNYYDNNLNTISPLKNKILIIVGTDKGMCGSHNNKLLNHFNKLDHNIYNNVFVVGKKLLPLFKKNNILSTKIHYISWQQVEKNQLHNQYNFLESTIDFLVFIKGIVKIISLVKDKFLEYRTNNNLHFPILPNNKINILNNLSLLHKIGSINIELIKYQMDENKCRDQKLQSAIDNIKDLLQLTKRNYSIKRQDIITSGINEIMGAKNAMDK